METQLLLSGIYLVSNLKILLKYNQKWDHNFILKTLFSNYDNFYALFKVYNMCNKLIGMMHGVVTLHFIFFNETTACDICLFLIFFVSPLTRQFITIKCLWLNRFDTFPCFKALTPSLFFCWLSYLYVAIYCVNLKPNPLAFFKKVFYRICSQWWQFKLFCDSVGLLWTFWNAFS